MCFSWVLYEQFNFELSEAGSCLNMLKLSVLVKNKRTKQVITCAQPSVVKMFETAFFFVFARLKFFFFWGGGWGGHCSTLSGFEFFFAFLCLRTDITNVIK